jgi:hypothetical protein
MAFDLFTGKMNLLDMKSGAVDDGPFRIMAPWEFAYSLISGHGHVILRVWNLDSG